MFNQTAANRFLQALTYWLRGGTQLDQALHGIFLMSQENHDRRVIRLSRQVRHLSKNGKSLSFSLRRYLNADEQSLLLVGEKSGDLFAALDMIVTRRHKQYLWRRASQRQMTYPAVLAIVSFVVLYIVSSYLVPAILIIYHDSTAVTAGIAQGWIRAYFFMTILFVAALIAISIAKRRGQHLPYFASRFTQMRTLSLLSFCQVLALSLQSKQSLLELLFIAQDKCSAPVCHALQQVTIRLRQGVSQLERLLAAGGIPQSILFEVQLLRKEGVSETEIIHKACKRVAEYATRQRKACLKYAITTSYLITLINIALVVNTLSNAMSLIVQQIV